MQIKMTKAMKNDRTKASIEIKLIKARKYDARKVSSNQTTSRTNSSSKITAAAATIAPTSESSNAPDTATFAISTFYTTNAYSLRNSWILDNGSNDHVCNSIMKHRFIKTREGTEEKVTAGSEILEIKCYGNIQIIVSSSTGLKLITLIDVCYVPDFMINIVSDYRLFLKRVYFDG